MLQIPRLLCSVGRYLERSWNRASKLSSRPLDLEAEAGALSGVQRARWFSRTGAEQCGTTAHHLQIL